MERSPQVAQLLAQFPGPISFDRTPLSKFLHQLAGLGMALGALAYVCLHLTLNGLVAGIGLLAFGGAVAFMKVRWTLDRTGFFTAHGHGIRWSDAHDFKIRMTNSGTVIFFNGNAPSPSWAAWSNRLIAGRDHCIYVDPGGLSSSELEDLMNGWRRRAVGVA
jgi:hypothetical protein